MNPAVLSNANSNIHYSPGNTDCDMLTNVVVELKDLSTLTMTYAHRDAYIFRLDSALPLNDDVNIHEFASTPASTIAILVTCKAIIAFPSTTAGTSLYTNLVITTNAAVLHIQSYN